MPGEAHTHTHAYLTDTPEILTVLLLFLLAHGLLSCVSAVFGVCSSGLFFFLGGDWGGGGLITSRLHTSYGTDYEFLGIYRLWRV